ncbi:MAG: L,D-transpeptidase family protein [Pseudomonadota bacterium]
MNLTHINAAALLLAVLIGGWTIGAQPAAADDRSWNPFRASSASYSASQRRVYDREFVRKWEVNPPRGFATLSRANIEPTKAAIARYKKLVADGGWPAVDKVALRSGSNGRGVRKLHDRLIASGDLRQASYYPSHFGHEIERALKRFQASNGLSPTGVTDKRTVAALNISAKTRLRQLRINLRRLRSKGLRDRGEYLVVNIPAQQVEAIDAGRVVSRHAGVVGKIDRKTPILKSRIHEINFNPAWRLPPTVIRKDLIPRGRSMAREKRDVLAEFDIDAYSGGRKLDSKKVRWNSSQPYQLSYRQKPGKKNPLGFAKINFHNQYSVYLHDTPSDRIFGRNFRAASSGCIRVSNIEPLLAWLLKKNDGWSRGAVDAIKESGKTKTVSLKRRVPLHMVYITAWATPDGVVQFRRDIYRRDGVGGLAAAY